VNVSGAGQTDAEPAHSGLLSVAPILLRLGGMSNLEAGNWKLEAIDTQVILWSGKYPSLNAGACKPLQAATFRLRYLINPCPCLRRYEILESEPGSAQVGRMNGGGEAIPSSVSTAQARAS
jgi:hypothetical protein